MRRDGLFAGALVASWMVGCGSSADSSNSVTDAAIGQSGIGGTSAMDHDGGGIDGAAGPGGTTQSGGSSGAGGSKVPSIVVGTIGTGQVKCYVPGMCPAHQACCNVEPFTNDHCVSTFGDCAGYQTGSTLVVGCDKPSDCPGQTCCAAFSPLAPPTIPEFVATSCKDTCGAGETALCLVDGDCPSKGRCHASSVGFMRCF
jgi:hypothetical protein